MASIKEGILQYNLPTFTSIYDFQYFICPLCDTYKSRSKQVFVHHVWKSHPGMVGHLKNIQDGSMDDVNLPWDQMVIELIDVNQIKTESLAGNQILVGNDDVTEEFILDPTGTNDDEEIIDNDHSMKIVQKNSEVLPPPKLLNTILKFTNFKCAKCPKVFASLQELKSHVRIKHRTDCDVCGKVFTKNATVSQIREHKQICNKQATGNGNEESSSSEEEKTEEKYKRFSFRKKRGIDVKDRNKKIDYAKLAKEGTCPVTICRKKFGSSEKGT